MSGIEVAGLVLGAFPIALLALEKFQNALHLCEFWFEVKAEYQKCKMQVEFHNIDFRRNLKHLVLPLVADQTLIDRLLADPGGVEWREPSIARQLEDRLQESYALYLELMQQLNITMEELNKELAGNNVSVQEHLAPKKESTSIMQNAGSKLVRKIRKSAPDYKYELYRVKFTVGKAKRTLLFQELKECNERLEKLLLTSDNMSHLEAKADLTRRAANLALSSAITSLWRYADGLYRTVAVAWNCSCASEHRAKIMLQHRTDTDVDFMLLLLNHSTFNNASSTWRLRETKIKVLDAPAPQVGLTTSIAVPPFAVPASVLNRRISEPARSYMTGGTGPISRIQPLANSKAINVSLTVTPPAITRVVEHQQARTPTPNSDDNEIQSLCGTFAAHQSVPVCCGYLQDGHQRYYIYPSTTELGFTLDNPVTLEDLLRHGCQQFPNRRQRYCLALIIASSFVQLRDSPWIQSVFNKKEITFFRDTNDANVIILDRPYVERAFSATTGISNEPENVSGIALLGIVLLELCFGTLIDDRPIRQRNPFSDEHNQPMLDLLAALDWLRDVPDEAGADYASAAEWCLLGSRTIPDGDSWRKLFFDNVVQPLERCHQYLGSRS